MDSTQLKMPEECFDVRSNTRRDRYRVAEMDDQKELVEKLVRQSAGGSHQLLNLT